MRNTGPSARAASRWGLVTQYQGRQLPGPLTQTQNDFTWAQDSVGNSYIQTSLTTLDPGQTYQAQKKSVQSVDNYGNVTQVQNYDFGNLSTPAKTYNYTYLNSSAYINGYILNRMASSSVTIGSTTTPLTTITYDLYGTSSGGHSYPALASVASGLWQWGNPSSTTRRSTRAGNFARWHDLHRLRSLGQCRQHYGERNPDDRVDFQLHQLRRPIADHRPAACRRI